MALFRAFWNSPIGPKKTLFWGPALNWSIPIAVRWGGTAPKLASSSCHVLNETVQLYQLSSWMKAPGSLLQEKEEAK